MDTEFPRLLHKTHRTVGVGNRKEVSEMFLRRLNESQSSPFAAQQLAAKSFCNQ